MGKVDYIEFQDRNEPLAYLITFRTYGSWLHGDERGSIDRRNYNRYGTLDMPTNKKLLAAEVLTLKTAALLLDWPQRKVIDLAIREVCECRGYSLHAVSVRTI